MGVEELKGLGWRQGSVIPTELARLVLDEAEPSGSLLLVISHDCDVTNSSLDKEPSVELLLATPVASGDTGGGNYTWGKNQRIYQLSLREGDACRPYRIEVCDRRVVDRELLVGYRPDPAIRVDINDVTGLARWVSKRYRRSALPDEFNARRSPANRAMNSALKAGGDAIASLLIAIDPEEKGPGEVYDVSLRAVMRVEKHSDLDQRTKAEFALNQLVAELDECEGITVSEAMVVGESDVTQDDLRFLRELDEFENLSIRQDPLADLPPT